jgi:hypothetical protein
VGEEIFSMKIHLEYGGTFTKLFMHARLSFLDRQSSEQNNRKLISLHNNGEDEKHAHGFADF